jgi:group I intron endonuclease
VIVYLARNRLNGKGYVGKTKRTLEQRTQEHLRFASKGSPQPLHRAIRKYGVEAFEWRILVEGDCTEEQLGLLEQDFIERLGTFGTGGYNATKGGDGVRGWSPTPEHREKIAAAHRGEKSHNFGKSWGRKGPCSATHKRNISEGKFGTGTGPRPHARGPKHSPESKLRISLAAARPKVAIPVHQLDTEGNVVATYNSVNQACLAIGCRSYGIKACCEGRRKMYAGFGWAFIKE